MLEQLTHRRTGRNHRELLAAQHRARRIGRAVFAHMSGQLRGTRGLARCDRIALRHETAQRLELADCHHHLGLGAIVGIHALRRVARHAECFFACEAGRRLCRRWMHLQRQRLSCGEQLHDERQFADLVDEIRRCRQVQALVDLRLPRGACRTTPRPTACRRR